MKMITKKNNAHLITAIKDTTFLDVFTPGNKDGSLSQFLSVMKANKAQTKLTAKVINQTQAKLPTSLQQTNNEIEFIH